MTTGELVSHYQHKFEAEKLLSEGNRKVDSHKLTREWREAIAAGPEHEICFWLALFTLNGPLAIFVFNGMVNNDKLLQGSHATVVLESQIYQAYTAAFATAG